MSRLSAEDIRLDSKKEKNSDTRYCDEEKRIMTSDIVNKKYENRV